MYALVEPFVKLCLLSRNPQDLPVSRRLLNFTLAGYLLLSMLLAMPAYGLPLALLEASVELAVMIGYTHALLKINAHPERVVQTLTALSGAGVLLGLAALPLSRLALAGEATDSASVPMLAFAALSIWSLIVYGHIFRHALSRGQLGGFLAALGFMLFTSMVTLLLFGVPGSGA